MLPTSNRVVILSVFGTLLIFMGVAVCVFWPTLLNRIIVKELPLSPTSQSFEVWKDSNTIPMYLEIYFFNWTNPLEIKTPGKKPAFVQLGPYTFLERREKVNITFHPENGTVSYKQKRTWYFDEGRSNGSLSDNITQLNVVALSAVHKIRYWAFYWHSALSVMMAKVDRIDITKTVGELLFDGYSDHLIDMGKISPVADIPPFDKFGWFYLRNGSAAFDGYFNAATGQDDITKIGTLLHWNYKNTTNYYKTPCNAVEGSAGEFWSPKRTKDEITLFSPDICRSITYEYEGISRHYGIDGYRYVIGEKTLSNSTKRRYPHEQAKYFETPMDTTEDFFSMDKPKESYVVPGEFQDPDPDVVNVGQCFCDGECIPSGLVNITACRYGAPGFVSLPHFHKADPIYREQIEGMNPIDEKHGFHITLEPATGLPIDVAARLQINILLQPSSYLSLYDGVPKTYFPMFWFNERVGITEELASSLRLFLKLPQIGFYSSVIMMILGSMLLIGAGVLYYLNRRKIYAATNTKPHRIVSPGQKSELVYLDTTVSNEEDQARRDRQLYPKLLSDNPNL